MSAMMNNINYSVMSNIHIDNINNGSKTTKINNSIFCAKEKIWHLLFFQGHHDYYYKQETLYL